MYTNSFKIHKKMIVYLIESGWKIARYATDNLYNFVNVYDTNYAVTSRIYVTGHYNGFGDFYPD